MSRADDLWRARLRADATVKPDPGVYRPGTPSFLGKVTSTGPALGVGKFCKVVPVSATGTEADNAAAVLTAGTATVLAYPVGPGTPATGDYVVVRRVNYRWVFDEPTGAGTGIATGGCCTGPNGTSPAVIRLTPNAGCYAGFVGATLTYGPRPAEIVNITSGLFCNPGWWSPRMPDTDGRGDYYYCLCACNIGLLYNAGFVTIGIYDTNWTSNGGVAYTSFPAPTPGRCSPYLFVGGSQAIFPGENGTFTMSG